MFSQFIKALITGLFGLLIVSIGFGQNDRLKVDLNKSFKKFDVVHLNTQQALTDFESGKTLKLRTSEQEFELILEPRDMRPLRFRAEDTGVNGVRQLPRDTVSTFRGYIKDVDNSKVRLNLSGEMIEGYFVSDATRFYIESARHYSALAKPTDFIIYRAEDYLGDRGFDCHSELMKRIEGGTDFVESRGVSSLTGAGVIELATEADFQFVNELGGANQANAEILSILNMVEGIFEEQLNLSIQVVFQHTWSTADPYTGANPQLLNSSFQDYWNINYPASEYPRDTAHLFSAKSGVLSQGYAFIGTVCRSPLSAYGMSGRISWEPGKFLVTGHELAHNVGGNHADAAQSCGNTIMNSALTGATPLVFCQFSKNEIGNYINANGNCLAPPNNVRTRFDFDGDNKTDAAIYRPLLGQWWYLRSSDSANRAFQFGTDTDRMVPADYTGDGKTDIAFWRESTGELFVLRSEDASFYSFPFGTAGDIPAPGDFDSDGLDDFAVFRPATGTWYLLDANGNVKIKSFGTNGDIPIVNDYDGDGYTDLAIFRPGVNQWWINRSSDGIFAMQFGAAGDKPVAADFTGDGKADVAFFRPSTGQWYVVRSEDTSFYAASFGMNGDIPVPGDYDGDGIADLAVWRPGNKTWYISGSQNGFSAVGFGSNGDIPVPASFLP
jgi:hypothetical protein